MFFVTYFFYSLSLIGSVVSGGKLAALEEFKVQKEDLMAKFAMMEEELAKKDADHKEHLYSLEKKAVMDKDR